MRWWYWQWGVMVVVALLFLGWVVAINPDYGAGDWLRYGWLFPVAFLISLTVNTIGISGAALFVPFLIIIFPWFAAPLSHSQSVLVGLITESFGLASSAGAFLSFGLVDRRIASFALLGSVAFVGVGSFVSLVIPEAVLLLMIAALLVVSGVLLRFEAQLRHRRQGGTLQSRQHGSRVTSRVVTRVSTRGAIYQYWRTWKGYLQRFVGYGVGAFFQGAVGFGIGELGIITMILSGVPVRMAIGTSHIVVAVTAIVASLFHLVTLEARAVELPWNIIVLTVPAAVLGGQLAPFIAARAPVRMLERGMSFLFLVIALSLAVVATRSW